MSTITVAGILQDYYNADIYKGKRVSDQDIQGSWNIAVGASATATLDCVDIWGTDFRADLERINVPTLVLHGDADRIVPFPASGLRTHQFIRDSRLVVVPEGPHGIIWTHPEIVNPALIDFLD
jgi:non-heme chloroperoxidase